ncbi:MAG TPA: DUF2950 family protein [Planctomycetota bacterium]|nr:DUF2950 family protein [Planctomycetota bacterium]
MKRDLEAGKFRRNHMAAIVGCKVYVDAQEAYRRTDHNKDNVLEYSQSLQGNHSLFELAAGKGDLKLISKEWAEAHMRRSERTKPNRQVVISSRF